MSATHDLTPGTAERVVQLLRAALPGVLAVYGFGSRVQGQATGDSDLDVAVLVAGYADVLALWDLSGELADMAGCAVDLVDLRAASTVLQYQIITGGALWWALDSQAALFESAILSEKTALDTARAGLLQDIAQRGSVYGR